MAARRHSVSTYLWRNVSARTAVLVLAMLIFFKYVFTCPCTSPEQTLQHCWLYLCLPVGILFFAMILIDSQLLKICRCYCARAPGRCGGRACCCCCCCCCGRQGWFYCAMIWKHLLNVFVAGSLWVAVVFVDGEWYVCVRTVDWNRTDVQVACKELPNEREAETIRKYDSESRVIGLMLLFGFSLLLTICSSLMALRTPHYKSLYEEYLQQEVQTVLEERLHEKAVERAKHISELSLRDMTIDTHHVQYRQLGNQEEDFWRQISDPAFHLVEIP